MVISFHHFKLFKEFHYEDTFGKDEKLRKEYNDYVNMNKMDKKRFDRLKQLGCVACSKKYKVFSEPVIHHIRKHTGISRRPDHQDQIIIVKIVFLIYILLMLTFFVLFLL